MNFFSYINIRAQKDSIQPRLFVCLFCFVVSKYSSRQKEARNSIFKGNCDRKKSFFPTCRNAHSAVLNEKWRHSKVHYEFWQEKKKKLKNSYCLDVKKPIDVAFFICMCKKKKTKTSKLYVF